MANITEAIPELSTVPQCIYPAYQTIAAAGCGLDLKCICTDDAFWRTLQGVFAKKACTPLEAQNAMARTRSICTTAAPYLAESLVSMSTGLTTMLTIVAVVAVILRFLARSLTTAPCGMDDWIILFALVWECGLSATQFLAVRYGYGHHILMVEASHVIPFGQIYFSASLCFITSLAAIKISILIFYHRIFPIRKFMMTCIAIGIFVVLWFIASIIATFFICRPLAYRWDKSIPGGHCLNTTTIGFYVVSAPDIITNLVILILPIPYLWGLQMQTRRKVAITIIFLLGSFATIGSVVRIPLLVKLNVNDTPYTTVSPGLWLNVELSLGILSASLPSMRPLCSRAIPSRIRSQVRSLFSHSRHSGTHRLEDAEGVNGGTISGSRAPHSKALSDSGIYQGQNKQQPHKSWYNAGAHVSSKKTGRHSEDGSEEDMVPMGRIHVKHDLEWEQERGPRSASQSGGTTDTLR